MILDLQLPKEPAARWLYIGTRLLIAGLVLTLLTALEGRNDLDIYLAASNDLWAGKDIYHATWFDGYHYFYSPLFAIAISPLTWAPVWLAKLVWGIGMLLLLLRCFVLVHREWLPTTLTTAQRSAILFFALLFLFQAIRDNIDPAQVTPLVLWLCLEGVMRINAGAPLRGAVLLALGIDLKLIPLVLVPWMAYRGHWRALLACCAAFTLLQILPALLIGWSHGMDLLHARWGLLAPTDVRNVLDDEEPSFIALSSLLTAYFSDQGHGTQTLDLPRTIIVLSPGMIAALLTLGRLALAALAVFFLRWPPLRRATSSQQSWWEVSYLLLCTVLLFPHQRYYSMLLAMPAALWLAMACVLRWRAARPRGWVVLPVLVFLGASADMLLGEYAAVYKHYKLMSFVVIALIAMLAWYSPERIAGFTARDKSSPR